MDDSTYPASDLIRSWFIDATSAHRTAAAPIHADDPRLAVLAGGEDAALAALVATYSPEALGEKYAAAHLRLPPFPLRPAWVDHERLWMLTSPLDVTLVQTSQTSWRGRTSARVARQLGFTLDDDGLPVEVIASAAHLVVNETTEIPLLELEEWTQAMGLAVGNYSARRVGSHV